MSKGAPDYTKITLLKGAAPDGSLVTLAVDASGNILAVLKGEYGGVLKTVQTDANGLLLAKIYDPDDIFGVSGTIGLGELAARLGSIMSFDRRGQFVWGDDFEQAVLKWNTALGGTGASVALATDNAYSKAQSVKLTGGSDGGKYAEITKNMVVQTTGRMGIEATVSLSTLSNIDRMRILLRLYNGTTFHTALMDWDVTNSQLEIMNSAGTFIVVVDPYTAPGIAQSWHKFKLVADFTTKKYVRLIYGDQSVDLSAYSMQEQSSVVAPQCRIEIYGFSTTGNNGVVWVDDVILTKLEP